MSVVAPHISPAVSWANETTFLTDVTTAEYPAVPASVRVAREAVVAVVRAAGADPDTAEDVCLAVSEAATNVVCHAYRGETGGRFRVITALRRDHLLVTIEDDGCGLGAPSYRPGLGMGLGLMGRVADQAHFCQRDLGGSSVQLRFDLG